MENCILCEGKTQIVADLGRFPLPEEFRTKVQLSKKVQKFPLILAYCTNCFHLQLRRWPSPKKIYPKHYFYDFSLTRGGQKHWHALTKKLIAQNNLKPADFVVDIGSNTGFLLQLFKKKGIKNVLGVDPSRRVADVAKRNGIKTHIDFFNHRVGVGLEKKYGKAKLILCTNTFDHIENLDSFLSGVVELLSDDGIFVVEVPYALNMINHLSHIPYHQQIHYFFLDILTDLMEKHSLNVFHAELIPLHGGSLRVYISKNNGVKKTMYLNKIKHFEKKALSNRTDRYRAFAADLIKHRDVFINRVKDLKKNNFRIAAVGASAKGITFLNYCNMGSNDIDFIAEKSNLKINLYTPSGIPIVPDDKLTCSRNDYAIILAWNFASELMEKFTMYKKNQGRFIIPFPKIIIK